MHFGKEVLPVLYKFCKAEHAEQMVRDGGVFIGTFDYYKDFEKTLGPDIGDPEDNSKTVTQVIDGPEYHTKQTLSSFAQKHIGLGEHGSAMLHNVHLRTKFVGRNSYIFCVADARDADMGPTVSYDACIRINDSLAFFRAMGQRMYQLGLISDFAVDTCSYEPRKRDHTEDTHTPVPFVKDSRYANQCEVRAVFSPVYERITAKPYRMPELSQYCERLY